MILPMWTVRRDNPGSVATLRLRFLAGGDCLSYEGFLCALAKDASFRDVILKEMRAAPFTTFRWETPPLTSTNIDQPFECLLHDSPDLDVRADPTDFEPYFQPGSEVVSFNNLGADALLIVPCPTSASTNYSHIGAFHRSAPQEQIHAFWKVVAQTVMLRLGPQPLRAKYRRWWGRLASYATGRPTQILSAPAMAELALERLIHPYDYTFSWEFGDT